MSSIVHVYRLHINGVGSILRTSNNDMILLRQAKRKALRKALAGQGSAGAIATEDKETPSAVDNHGAEATIEDAPKSDLLLEAERLEAELESGLYDLPAKIEKEKNKLLAAGFPDWTKADFKIFINSLEQYGTMELDAVVSDVCAETNKTPQDVKRYYVTFFKKHKCLSDGARIMEKIHKGQKRIERLRDIRIALEMKLLRHYGSDLESIVNSPLGWSHPESGKKLLTPWTITFTHSSSKGRLFSEEEDRFLVLMMYKHGYGREAWKAIHHEICQDPTFRFDWFFLSRQASDIQRRCDLLLRAIEKENTDYQPPHPVHRVVSKSNRQKVEVSSTDQAPDESTSSCGGLGTMWEDDSIVRDKETSSLVAATSSDSEIGRTTKSVKMEEDVATDTHVTVSTEEGRICGEMSYVTDGNSVCPPSKRTRKSKRGMDY